MRNSNYGNYYCPSFFGGFQFFPPVIKNLLIINASVFLFLWLVGGSLMYRGEPVGAWIQYFLALHPIGHGFKVWQLLTYMFMHAGLWHLFFNMFALWMFGMELENVWGSKKFLTYYVLSGLGGGIAHMLIGPLFGPPSPTVGASGAIYGVLIAFGLMFPDRLIFIYFFVPVKAKYFVLGYTALELFNGISGTPDGLAHFAHLGGALVGYVYLLVDERRLPLHRWMEKLKARGKPDRYYYDSYAQKKQPIAEAKFYDIKTGKEKDTEEDVMQRTVDAILDKISKSGYQNLTEEEKKILFEASKKLN